MNFGLTFSAPSKIIHSLMEILDIGAIHINDVQFTRRRGSLEKPRKKKQKIRKPIVILNKNLLFKPETRGRGLKNRFFPDVRNG